MIVTQRGQTLSGVTNADLQALISKHRKEDADFGNARGVRNLVESAERSRDYRIAPRLAEIDSQELTQLTKEDVLGYSVKPERKQYLTTTFHEREEAKKLGAKWDKYAGKWYVLYKEGDSLAAFSKWLPKEDESRV